MRKAACKIDVRAPFSGAQGPSPNMSLPNDCDKGLLALVGDTLLTSRTRWRVIAAGLGKLLSLTMQLTSAIRLVTATECQHASHTTEESVTYM